MASLYTPLEALGQRDGMLEGLFRQHLGQGGAHGRHGERVAGERPADATDVHVVSILLRERPLGDLVGDAESPGRHAAAYGLARCQDVRVEPVLAGVAAVAGRNGVGLVYDEQCPVAAREIAERSWKPGSGSTIPMLVMAGSASTHATSSWPRASSSASTSLNSTTRVVRV